MSDFEKNIKPLMESGYVLKWEPKMKRYYTMNSKDKSDFGRFGIDKGEVSRLEKKGILSLMGVQTYELVAK